MGDLSERLQSWCLFVEWSQYRRRQAAVISAEIAILATDWRREALGEGIGLYCRRLFVSLEAFGMVLINWTRSATPLPQIEWAAARSRQADAHCPLMIDGTADKLAAPWCSSPIGAALMWVRAVAPWRIGDRRLNGAG